MKVVGEAAAHGSAERVWAALHDSAVLGRAIPGCEHFEVCGPGLGQFVARIELPAISGTYAAKLTITEQQRPSLLRLTASATADQGTIAADVTLRLSATAAGATLVSYEANGTVTGPAAAAGSRLLASAARRLAGEFFAAIDDSAAAKPASGTPDAPATRSAEPAAVPPGPLAQPGPVARPVPYGGNRTALVAGAAIGLAGVVIGILAGRRGARAGRVRA